MMPLIRILGAVMCVLVGIAILIYGVSLLIQFNDLTVSKFSKESSAMLVAIASILIGISAGLNGAFYLIQRLQDATTEHDDE